MSEPLNDLERAVLDCVIEYQSEHTYPPSVREIGAALSIGSTRTVSQLLGRLARKGWIERSPSRSRGIRVIGTALEPAREAVGPELEPARAEDSGWMARALDHARMAGSLEEVPVGAVLVRGDEVLAESGNLVRALSDPTAHAEMVAIRKAAVRQPGGRLLDTTMYVTLEPCAMCAGAIVLARIPRLVYGAADPKTGMCGSLANVVQDPRLNHRVRLSAGVLSEDAGDLLRSFFRSRRTPR